MSSYLGQNPLDIQKQREAMEKPDFEWDSKYLPYVIGGISLVIIVTVADYYKKKKRK